MPNREFRVLRGCHRTDQASRFKIKATIAPAAAITSNKLRSASHSDLILESAFMLSPFPDPTIGSNRLLSLSMGGGGLFPGDLQARGGRPTNHTNFHELGRSVSIRVIRGPLFVG